MEALNGKNAMETAECPLRNPFTANPKQCATCMGMHSPTDDMVSKHPWLKPIFAYTLPRAIFECAWGTIYWNKQFVLGSSKTINAAPSKDEMPFHFRLSYFVMATVISLISTFLFGIVALKGLNNWSSLQAGLAMLLIAGTGWVFQAAMALTFLQQPKWNYLSHLATVSWLGVMPLLAASILTAILGPLLSIVYIATVLISSFSMLVTHVGSVRKLGLSQWWTVSWFVCLQSTAVLWMYLLFYVFN